MLKIDEINALNPYKYMDEELDRFRVYMVRQYEKYIIMARKRNSFQLTRELYDKLRKRCEKMFLRIANHYYKEAGGKGEYDKDWLFDFLLTYDAVTGYQFTNEWERKRDRQFEEVESAIQAGKSPRKAIKRSMSLLNKQITQESINITDFATKDAYKKNKIKRVQWITQNDERVCDECWPRHLKVFDIDNIPDKHFGCRCWLVGVKE